MKALLLTSLIVFAMTSSSAADFSIQSPDQRIRLHIKTTDKLYYAVDFEGDNILWYSPLSMTLSDGTVLGKNPIIQSQQQRTVNQQLQTVWGIRSEIQDHFQELTLQLEGNYQVVFRAYNDGVAYRFITQLPGEIIVQEEEVAYRFLEDHELLAHVVGDFQTSYEKLYTRYPISKVVEKDFISLPLIVTSPRVKIAISEADLYDYPGLYLKRPGNNNRFFLEGLLPAYPTQWEPGGWCQFNLKVTGRAEYLARTAGTRSFPWRLMVIAEEDIELADNDLVYKLSRPSAIETDWIKPGLVAWDWWNDWNLTGVDFETGVNNRTYEYYIDFAAENGLPYVILDEGWSDQFDLLLQKPNIDVPHLVAYAAERNVKLILWCVWHTLDRQMQVALDQFADWGIGGIKVDFMDRDDQIMINFYEKLAVEAAKRKLLVDYHGCSKPTGLHRTYPNVINYEGVRGNEYNKFATDQTPGHNLDIVYTRMIVGPMDYTPGAMRNSTQGNFQTNNSNPMSYGTRCHQLGMYVVYYSPLNMLCDAPTAYERFPDILQFLSQVPTTWDETEVLAGVLGEYIVIARRKGEDWYLGAMGDWEERTIDLNLSFLGRGTYDATLFLDGVNANRVAEDYQVRQKTVRAGDFLSILLRKGGGAAIHFRKK